MRMLEKWSYVSLACFPVAEANGSAKPVWSWKDTGDCLRGASKTGMLQRTSATLPVVKIGDENRTPRIASRIQPILFKFKENGPTSINTLRCRGNSIASPGQASIELKNADLLLWKDGKSCGKIRINRLNPL